MGGGKAEKHIIPGSRIHVCNRECSSVWQFSAYLDCQNRRFDKQEKILSYAKALALWSQSGTEPIFVAYLPRDGIADNLATCRIETMPACVFLNPPKLPKFS